MINHEARFRQPLLFSNMRFETNGAIIMPTDVDGYLNVRDSNYQTVLHIFYEVKLRGVTLHNGNNKLNGQGWALTSLVDDLSKPGIILLCWHDVHDTKQGVDLARCVISERYGNRQFCRLVHQSYYSGFVKIASESAHHYTNRLLMLVKNRQTA